MKRSKMWQAGLRIMLASSLTGTLLDVGCLGTAARNFNPCGTILDCDPVEWDLMFHDYPDWDLDPTCTIPGLCGGNWPPTSASGAGVAADGGAGAAAGTGGWGTGGYGGYGQGGYGGYGWGGYGGGYGSTAYGGGYGSTAYGGGSYGGGYGGGYGAY